MSISIATVLPLWVFIALMVATPGPANMLLMTAGAQQGYFRTLPFIAGLIVGKLGLNLLMALGLSGFLLDNPMLKQVFAVIAGSYMAYLALRTWTPSSGGDSEQRFAFVAGLIVHPLNPKAWVMTTLAVTQFGGDFTTLSERLTIIPLSFIVIQIFAASFWCGAGVLLNRAFGQNLLLHRGLILLTLAVIMWALTL
jgi:threonine/homoserine/homoserine lactone efflux protein